MKKIFTLSCVAALTMTLYSFGAVSHNAGSYNETVNEIREKVRTANIIVVDFTKSSCSDRLFVYSEGKPVYSGAVLHGNGKGNTPGKPMFSNEPGSGCSCLGLFKVVGSKRMNNGYPSLILEGLSSTNSNAKARGILIHPSIMVSLLPFEISGACFPLTDASKGCFAVSLHTYRVVSKLKAPVYLYAKYDS